MYEQKKEPYLHLPYTLFYKGLLSWLFLKARNNTINLSWVKGKGSVKKVGWEQVGK